MASSKIKVFFDADVLLNWLVKEAESSTGTELWKSPFRIIQAIEEDKVEAYTSVITIMEVRYVLRRKKEVDEEDLDEMINDLRSNFSLILPDNMDIAQANNFQAEMPLDPFDSVYLALIDQLNVDNVLTRDKEFAELIEKSGVETGLFEPEEFVQKHLS